jgi:hypothetical protein
MPSVYKLRRSLLHPGKILIYNRDRSQRTVWVYNPATKPLLLGRWWVYLEGELDIEKRWIMFDRYVKGWTE